MVLDSVGVATSSGELLKLGFVPKELAAQSETITYTVDERRRAAPFTLDDETGRITTTRTTDPAFTQHAGKVVVGIKGSVYSKVADVRAALSVELTAAKTNGGQIEFQLWTPPEGWTPRRVDDTDDDEEDNQDDGDDDDDDGPSRRGRRR